jgi:haloacetate dehalogenase
VLRAFETGRIDAGGIRINVARGGTGPPILLLHGYPQTHVIWHRVAPTLAEHFTVVCTDLRGYGDSDKPLGGGDHLAYSKRAMARDQVEVMRSLGFDRFAVVGHDRGARVARFYLRWTLDE